MVSKRVRPQLEIVSTKVAWKTSSLVSARKSALASIPCRGDRSSCEMEPMKSAFWRSAATDVSLETSDR